MRHTVSSLSRPPGSSSSMPAFSSCETDETLIKPLPRGLRSQWTSQKWHTGIGRLMSIFIVQLGTSRKASEGLRLGTVRRPPRGVPKSDLARLDYYDVWFPNLSPSAELVREALGASDERA